MIKTTITGHLTREGSKDFAVQLVCFPQALFDDARSAFSVSLHPRCLVRVRWGASPSNKDHRKLHETFWDTATDFQLYQPHFFAIQALLDRSKLSLLSRTKDAACGMAFLDLSDPQHVVPEETVHAERNFFFQVKKFMRNFLVHSIDAFVKPGGRPFGKGTSSEA